MKEKGEKIFSKERDFPDPNHNKKVKAVMSLVFYDEGKVDLRISGNINDPMFSEMIGRLTSRLIESNNSHGVNGSSVPVDFVNANANKISHKLMRVLEEKFPNRWFTSSEVIEAYREMFGENLSPNTCSTYLSRLAKKGVLKRFGSRSGYSYIIDNNRSTEVVY